MKDKMPTLLIAERNTIWLFLKQSSTRGGAGGWVDLVGRVRFNIQVTAKPQLMKSFNQFNRNILLAGYTVQSCCLLMVNTFSLSIFCCGIIISQYDKGIQVEKC